MAKKILFMTARQNLTKMFWNDVCAKKAAEYGFEVDIPAADGDLTDPEWPKRIAGYDVLVTTWGSPVCTKEFLANAPSVKVVGHCAGSAAAVVNETTYETDVKVTTSNPVMAEAVAEWSLMATQLAQRNMLRYATLRPGDVMDWPGGTVMQDIKKMTIGLWGMGDTTRHLLKFLAPLRPGRILIASNHSSAEELAALGAQKATLEELLRESDVFHCLVGVNAQNYLRIGAKEFAMMKDGATFVNGGRARLTDEAALLAVLKTGRINAILDVFYEEPVKAGSPFYELSNVILTPHDAGFTGRDRFFPFLLDEFDRFFKGEKMLSEISKSRFLTMTNEKLR